MSNTPSLFDPDEGDRRREDGIARADEHAPPDWKAMAETAIASIPPCEATTDIVWDYLAQVGAPKPHEPRAMGAVMRKMARAGYCEPTDRFAPTKIPSAHRSPIRVWRFGLRHQ
jgi:hypothetical protein